MQCTLCDSKTDFFLEIKSKKYFKCPTCLGILLCKTHYLDFDNEKSRYDKHSVDVEDQGYKKFVDPIVNAVQNDFTTKEKGLDFGCGNSAIIKKILSYINYNVVGYDPFYFPESELLQGKYDYITSCEVIEHFYSPKTEFQLLHSMLTKGGKLYVKTNLYAKMKNFSTWWYKNDATHVFFYSKETMEYIKTNFGFKSLVFKSNHLEFSK